MKRSAPPRKRSKTRRGREIDRPYIAWMHEENGCLVAGRRNDSPCWGCGTVHHLRHRRNDDGTVERTGKIDRRTLLLCEGHHQHGKGPHGHAIHVMTANFGKEWEDFFQIDTEEEVRRYNDRYDGRAA